MKLMLIGSTQEDILKVNNTEDTSDVVDDFEFKEEDTQLHSVPENIKKVTRRCEAYRPRKLSEFRDGKKLLVLDLDYTIFDHLTPAESAHQLARPYLMEFLTRAYVHYDIAIWSATSITWILAKLSQLSIIPLHVAKTFQHRNYLVDSTTSTADNSILQGINITDDQHNGSFRIALILDSSDMISVNFTAHGIKEVKPLAVIWTNHSQWGPHNTIMLDDVRRNFVMNPQSGLRIRSYRDAHINYLHDRELLHLINYLELIAINEKDFTKLNHNHWERYVQKHYKQLNTLKCKQKKQLKCCQVDEITNNQLSTIQLPTSNITSITSSSLSSIYSSTVNSNVSSISSSSSSHCRVYELEEFPINSTTHISSTSSSTTITCSLTSGQKRVHGKNNEINSSDNDDAPVAVVIVQDDNHSIDTYQLCDVINEFNEEERSGGEGDKN
ncbi:Ubiquitin-like domain-containing CTD phosphatase 1 isoform 1 [Schistosoma japonicum]|nr:Ubiquitin-like domain-containing CTD phosphatase 1 isoform 1 [Schistosoma japonicum]